MNYSLIFDVVVALLLIVTIASAIVLNRKLSALRHAETDMKKLLGEFISATDKAEKALDALKDNARQSGASLQRQIGDARSLADDLAFLVEKGSNVADRLVSRSKVSSAKVSANSMPAAPRSGDSGSTAIPPSISGNVPAKENMPVATPAGKKLLKSLQGIR